MCCPEWGVFLQMKTFSLHLKKGFLLYGKKIPFAVKNGSFLTAKRLLLQLILFGMTKRPFCNAVENEYIVYVYKIQ